MAAGQDPFSRREQFRCWKTSRPPSAALSKERLAANQVLYHLGDRGIERRLIPYCAEQGIAVVGYSPFGHRGFPSPASRDGKVLAGIASRHKRTPRQVVLNLLDPAPERLHYPQGFQPRARPRERRRLRLDALRRGSWPAWTRPFPAPTRDTPLGMI